MKVVKLFLDAKDDKKHNVQRVIDLEVVPRIVSLLSGKFEASLDIKHVIMSEAAYVLSKITYDGDHEQTSSIVKAGAVPILVENVSHLDSVVRFRVSFQVSYFYF